jgi:hypothetical protein
MRYILTSTCRAKIFSICVLSFLTILPSEVYSQNSPLPFNQAAVKQSTKPALQGPKMLTIKESMELAGNCHFGWLNPELNYMPSNCYEAAHDIGRWWDAMLRLEDATGFAIPADIEGAMLQNLKLLTDNPDGLLMITPEVAAQFPGMQKDYTEQEKLDRALKGLHSTKMKPAINLHNFREGMLAFNALIRYRNNEWARQAGHRMLETIDKILQPDGTLDLTKLHCWGKMPAPDNDPVGPTGLSRGFASSTGRCLEAVVWFYEATGDALAIKVADRIARHHLAHTVNPEGKLSQEIVDGLRYEHTHSYLGTIRGLILFGLLTRQH